MKKLFFINLFASAVLCLAFVCIRNERTTCSIQCSSGLKDVKPATNKITGGAAAGEQLFEFNRIYLKI